MRHPIWRKCFKKRKNYSKQQATASNVRATLVAVFPTTIIPSNFRPVSHRNQAKCKIDWKGTSRLLILARARSPDRPFGKLPKSIRMAMEQQAQQAADVFQRSSSCVEGRNGQLSLRHHGLRELTASKLRALRTIHNYVIRRTDGRTAAERFFENKPRDLFVWLLEELPMPARPRQKRTQKT